MKSALELTDELIQESENSLKAVEVERDNQRQRLIEAQKKVDTLHSVLSALKTLKARIMQNIPAEGIKSD